MRIINLRLAVQDSDDAQSIMEMIVERTDIYGCAEIKWARAQAADLDHAILRVTDGDNVALVKKRLDKGE